MKWPESSVRAGSPGQAATVSKWSRAHIRCRLCRCWADSAGADGDTSPGTPSPIAPQLPPAPHRTARHDRLDCLGHESLSAAQKNHAQRILRPPLQQAVTTQSDVTSGNSICPLHCYRRTRPPVLFVCATTLSDAPVHPAILVLAESLCLLILCATLHPGNLLVPYRTQALSLFIVALSGLP